MASEQMLVIMKTMTPTAEAAPMWPLLLENFKYMRMLLVRMEEWGIRGRR